MNKNIFQNKTIFFLFFGSFALYFFLGFYFQYNSQRIFRIFDLIFNMDISFAYSSLFNSENGNHLRNIAHTFFTNLLYPIAILFEKITFSQKLGAIFLNSLCGSFVVLFLYKTFLNFTNKRNHSILFILLYALSFSTMIFSCFVESYIYSAFFSVLNLYYISLIYNQCNLTKNNFFVLSFLTFCSFSIVTANLIPNLIMIYFLLKKIYKENKLIFKNFGIILSIILFFFACFSLLAHFSYENRTHIQNQIAFEKMQFGENFSSNSFSTVIGRIFSGSFYYLNSKLIGAHFPFLAGANASFDIYLPSILFYLFAIYFFVLNFKQILKNFLATPLSLIVVICTIESLFYCNCGAFLFSQNFLPYFILLLLIIFLNTSSRVLLFSYLSYLFFILIRNFYGFSAIQSFLVKSYKQSFDFSEAFLMTSVFLLILFILTLVLIFIRKKILLKISSDDLIFCSLIVYLTYVFVFGIIMAILR